MITDGKDQRFVPTSSTSTEQFALITIVESDLGRGRHRAIVFSGTVSTTAEAAVSFFSSPQRLQELRQKLPKPLPGRYQIVVRARLASQVALASEYSYVTHATQ